MTRKLHVLVAASLLAVFGAATLPAQPHDHPGPPKPGDMPPPNPKMMARFDTNKDGKLDDAEKAEAKKAWEAKEKDRHAKVLEKFDTNKDGKLDEKEKAAADAAREKWHQDMLKRFDKNQDGKLDPQERQEAMKAFEDGPGGPEGAGGPPPKKPAAN